MPVVALCEDDAALRSATRRGLEAAGFEVREAATGAELFMVCERFAPDVVVLDIGLPDADGRDVCLALRARNVNAPILMLTALDGTHNKVAGFQAGADDYLTKPFDLVELEMRVEALLRRVSLPVHASSGLVLDPGSHTLSHESTCTALSPTEFKLLARLMSTPGSVVRRRELVGAGWAHGAHVSENTLDSYVRRLRVKVAEVDDQPHIATVRGLGYRWD